MVSKKQKKTLRPWRKLPKQFRGELVCDKIESKLVEARDKTAASKTVRFAVADAEAAESSEA